LTIIVDYTIFALSLPCSNGNGGLMVMVGSTELCWDFSSGKSLQLVYYFGGATFSIILCQNTVPTIQNTICDCLSETIPSLHNYKYLEILI